MILNLAPKPSRFYKKEDEYYKKLKDKNKKPKRRKPVRKSTGVRTPKP